MEPQREVERAAPRRSRRKRMAVAVAVLLAYLVVESFFPPKAQPSAYVCLGLIKAYQATFSKVLKASGAKCRFTPTCSHYGVGAIEKYGTLPGIARTAGRIFRCAPWGPPPGEDLP